MVRNVVKNGHQQDICYDDIGLCAQNIFIIIVSIVNSTIGSGWQHTVTQEEWASSFGLL